MSITAAKSPLKDPLHVPAAEDVDRHLNQFSRYARVVRGAARVSGLSARLAWTNSGWVEQFKLDDEVVLGSINLVRVPPVASIPVSRVLEEQLAGRVIPESVRQAIAQADGSQLKWVELELLGPLQADTMAALITVKTELVRAGVVPIVGADRPKPVPRPELEPIRESRPAKAARQSAKPAKGAPKAARSAPKKPAAKKAAPRKAAPKKAKPAKKPAAKKAAKSGKRR